MLSSLMHRRAFIAGAGFITVIAGAVVSWQHLQTRSCPAGYELRDPVSIALKHRGAMSAEQQAEIRAQFGNEACFSPAVDRLLEKGDREIARHEYANSLPNLNLLSVLSEKKKLMENQGKVANAAGKWTPYGKGALVGDPEFAGGIATLGIQNAAGLVADLEYDKGNKRLFAAVSSGGVWVSEAVGGDLATLGNSWTDIGRNLPTQATAHVSWSPGKDDEPGTLLVLTGEHTLDGGSFASLGVHWSSDLGKTWNAATGMDDSYGGAAFHMAVDPGNPNIVYAATGRGLYRSTDTGRSFVNVNLPTGDCAGNTDIASPCFLANVVTDVVVQTPGGFAGRAVNCGNGTPCPVLAAVGWPEGAKLYKDDVTPQSPNNGLYKSTDGVRFTKVGLVPAPAPADVPAGVVPVGFAPQHQIGRIELAAATGESQDHNFVYAIVDDALLERGGLPVLDVDDPNSASTCNMLIGGQDPTGLGCPVINGVTHATAFNGIYVSPDFGGSWVRLADEIEVSYNPAAGSALVPVFFGLAGYGPGIQASYNLSLAVDPTGADLMPAQAGPIPAGVPVPTRVVFGLEEVFATRLPVPLGGLPGTQPGPASDFHVIGEYFAGDLCYAFLALPACPQQPTEIQNPVNSTPHPDQHDALFIPDDNGGVWLFVANDGGVFKQHSTGPEDPLDNHSWSDGLSEGMNTLLIYGMGVAKDGTVVVGLQDNGSAKIEPSEDGNGGRILSIGGGDGVYSQVDPDDSQVIYQQTPGLAIDVSFDGGRNFQGAAPAAGVPHFTSPYMLDPADSSQVVAAGSIVAVSADGGFTGTSYTQVFDLGVDEASGLPHQSRLRAIDIQDGAAYVGWCGPCVPALLSPAQNGQFQRGLATNVTATGKPSDILDPTPWHQASANGLPRRYIHAVESDPKNPKTVFVGLGNYSTARYLPTGAYLDTNDRIEKGRIFKSTDAGENFKDITGKLPDTIVTSLLATCTQLIAGTDLGAFISSDLDGSDWALMGDLPAIAVNQLVQDPANSKRIFAATYGRGVWTYNLTEECPTKAPPVPAVPVAPPAPTERPEGGFLLGALSPALLMLLGLGLALRRKLH